MGGDGLPFVAKCEGGVMDIKTILIAAGLVFVLWSCAGVSAAPATMSTAPDSTACYDAALAAVRDVWPALSQFQRAA